MNFNEFTKKYGSDTTTNFQLIKWAKELKLKPFYYCMRDEIISKLNTKIGKYFAIVNIHTSDQSGIHHSAIYKNSLGEIFFFDSYGLNPTAEIILLNRSGNILSSTFQIQKPETKWCGQLSLWVLYQLSLNSISFEDIVLNLKKEVEKNG